MATFDPLRPDLLLGQQQVGGSTVPLQSRRGTGPLAGFTTHFALNLTNFDWTTWHAYEWENWVVVDALLQDALYGIDIRGAWQPNTDYTAGEIVIDTTTGEILLATTSHTSTDDIAADRAAELWQTYSVNEAFVGRGGDTMSGDLGFVGTNVGVYFDDTVSPDIRWRLRNSAGSFAVDDASGHRLLLTADDMRALGMTPTAGTSESLMTRARTRADHYTKTEQNTRDAAVDASLADRYTKAVVDNAFAERDETLSNHAADIANRYTKAESDTKNLSQDQSIANNAAAAASANTNANTRMKWRGDWAAGSYAANDVVQDGEFLFVARTATEEKPDNGQNPPTPADWDLLVSGGGSAVTVGDDPPDLPLPGDLWFATAEPVGLYVWIDDGTSTQWVQASGGTTLAQVHVGDDPPIDPIPNQLWYKTSAPIGLYAYYDDGNSQQWVQTGDAPAGTNATITSFTDATEFNAYVPAENELAVLYSA